MSGLRDNFDARARWRLAIASARAVHRLGMGVRNNTGGDRTNSDDDESDLEDDDEGDAGSEKTKERVVVDSTSQSGTEVSRLVGSETAHTQPTLSQEPPLEGEDHTLFPGQKPAETNSKVSKAESEGADKDEQMPGTLHFPDLQSEREASNSGDDGAWSKLLEKLRLKE